ANNKLKIKKSTTRESFRLIPQRRAWAGIDPLFVSPLARGRFSGGSGFPSRFSGNDDGNRIIVSFLAASVQASLSSPDSPSPGLRGFLRCRHSYRPTRNC